MLPLPSNRLYLRGTCTCDLGQQLEYCWILSLLGQNVILCCQRYNFSPADIISVVSNNTVKQSFRRSIDSSDCCSADFVRELILARDGALDINCVLTRDEVQEMIGYICSSLLFANHVVVRYKYIINKLRQSYIVQKQDACCLTRCDGHMIKTAYHGLKSR
jgi:hypothetical protein